MAPGPHRQVFVDGVNFRPLNAGLKCFERARLQPCRNDQQKEKKGTGFSPYILAPTPITPEQAIRASADGLL